MDKHVYIYIDIDVYNIYIYIASNEIPYILSCFPLKVVIHIHTLDNISFYIRLYSL